jgi:hypothetical protein
MTWTNDTPIVDVARPSLLRDTDALADLTSVLVKGGSTHSGDHY